MDDIMMFSDDNPALGPFKTENLKPGERTEMERIIYAHTAHRAEELDKAMILRNGQMLANYRYEISRCTKCGKSMPAVHIDVLRQTLQAMLQNEKQPSGNQS